MGKKRVTYDFNDHDNHPNQVPIDHHHHHHRHQNHQKPKRIKPETKLLHTLNSHLKKIAKSRSRNTISLTPPSSTVNPKSNKHRQNRLSSSLNQNLCRDWFAGSDIDHEADGHGGDVEVFAFGQDLSWKTMSYIGSENQEEDLFGGDSVFAPDLNAMVVFEEDGVEYGSYIPDPVMNMDTRDEGGYLHDVLHLSSQEEMINEFLKVNLFVS